MHIGRPEDDNSSRHSGRQEGTPEMITVAHTQAGRKAHLKMVTVNFRNFGDARKKK
jgi:hypothetical protein